MGQEVLKACSGKFMPIHQWYYFDGSDALPESLSMDEVRPVGSRYDGSIMIFGHTMQQQLTTLKMFLVGAGAIGCEMFKNWALMGIGCSPTGAVHVTDMDNIEKSNLSRQFLFRATDIGRAKSITAAKAAREMNPQMNTVAYELKVSRETEDVFHDDFFESLDFVCTALDNVEARLYMDQRCVNYQKPMLESGTLGTKGNTQVVVPFLTENYGATRDPPEQGIPICTLKFFPNAIAHTLQWAREWFEEQFKQVPDSVNQYVSLSPEQFKDVLKTIENVKLDNLSKIKAALVDECPRSIEDCIVWARYARCSPPRPSSAH